MMYIICIDCSSFIKLLGLGVAMPEIFPASMQRMQCLYQGHTTTIRNAARLSADCHSLKHGAAKQCHFAGFPTFEDALSDTLLTN